MSNCPGEALLSSDQPADGDGSRDERTMQAERQHRLLIVAVSNERQLHAECTGAFLIDYDRHADESELARIIERSRTGAVQEQRLAVHLWYNHGFTTFDHSARDSLTYLEDGVATLFGQPARCLNVQL